MKEGGKMRQTWIVVADNARARLFKLAKNGRDIEFNHNSKEGLKHGDKS